MIESEEGEVKDNTFIVPCHMHTHTHTHTHFVQKTTSPQTPDYFGLKRLFLLCCFVGKGLELGRVVSPYI
jgi:hypothetical protein